MEKAASNGKFDPTAGLCSSGIAGTGNDKEEEEGAQRSSNTDEEMKDVSKKDGGMCWFFVHFHITSQLDTRILLLVCPNVEFHSIFFSYLFPCHVRL